MELRDYLKIFFKGWFWLIIPVVLCVGFGVGYKQYKNSRPVSYQVALLLNVTRSGIQVTDSYRYDDFYRLQADERFADTVVRWLESPRIVTDIYNETGIASGGIGLKDLSHTFKVKRLSSQMIDVRFTSGSAREAQNISESLVKALNDETKELNQYQKEDNWFKVIGDEPVIKEFKVSWKDVLPISIASGFFLGVWTVLITNYLKKK